MSDIKDKYRLETNEDCYCDEWQVEGGSYKDEYVLWIEKQLWELIEWKLSAMNIFKEIDLQAIGKEIGVGIGQDIAKEILPYIRKMKSVANGS